MQHATLRIASDHDVGLEPALRALAREIAAGREMALDLQMTVGELVASPDAARREALFRLQDLDRLAQSLGDLAAFTDAVAGAAPRNWRIDGRAAVRDMRLRDLAVRLVADGAAGVATPSDPGSEDDFLL